MKAHKKRRRKKKRRNRKTFRQFLFQCWINVKKFFKALFFLVLLFAFLVLGYYIVDAILNREFTVYLALSFVICVVLSYILGYIISKEEKLDFINADASFDGGIVDFIICIILAMLFFILFGVTYHGMNYIIHKVTGSERFKSF